MYVIKYALLILVCITLSYIVPIVNAIKEKRAEIANSSEETQATEKTEILDESPASEN